MRWLRRHRDRAPAPAAPSELPGDAAPSREAAAEEIAGVVESLRAVVVANADGALAPDDVGAGDPLYESGHVDSMGGAALLAFIEDEYGVAVEEADLVGSLASLDALARHVAARRPRA